MVEESQMKTELSKWQKEKFSALFDLLDNDGDDRVDETEFEGMLDRLLIDTGWPENSRVTHHVSARWRVFSASLFKDSPHLSEQKWLEYLRAFLEKDRAQRVKTDGYKGPIEETAQLLFLVLDRDRNSEIDYQEFLLLFYALGHKDSAAEQSFEKLDSDGDEALQKDEVRDMTLEYFHGTEPGSAGDWLFGPPPIKAS